MSFLYLSLVNARRSVCAAATCALVTSASSLSTADSFSLYRVFLFVPSHVCCTSCNLICSAEASASSSGFLDAAAMR